MCERRMYVCVRRMYVCVRRMYVCVHEFTLTFNLIAVVGIFGLLSWGRAPSPEHGPNPENSPVPDEG